MKLLPGVDESRSAVLSECGTYRYVLKRAVSARGVGAVNFVMLNPSTADASIDDPTIRRCIGYAKAWGFAELVVTNLFGLRSTDPRALAGAEDPVGPDNDRHILVQAQSADLIVCGWGERGDLLDRDKAVLALLRQVGTPHYLSLTKSGQPGHPLFLSAGLRPVPMEDAGHG